MRLKTDRSFIDIPEKFVATARTLSPRVPPAMSDENEIQREFFSALNNPAGGLMIKDAIKPGGSTVVIVSDKTRKYGLKSWLPALLNTLNECGVPDEGITILTATGAHSGHTSAEIEALLGCEIAGRAKIVDHDCDSSPMTNLGRTSRGTPVLINSIAAEADNLITTGVVMPHYYAGFTGGRKSLLPGVAARESIFTNHGLNLAPGGGTCAEARTMSLAGNPIHEDMAEAAGMLRVACSINVVMGDGAPAAFFCGDIALAHAAACEKAVDWMGVPIRERAAWTIASCGGYPKDISMYQSHKSLDNSFMATRPGGALILATGCADGFGPDGFENWFDLGSAAAIEKKLREKYEVMGHTALRILSKTAAVKTILVSSLPDELVIKMGMSPAATLEEALENIDHSEPGIIIPEAATTVPVEMRGETAPDHV